MIPKLAAIVRPTRKYGHQTESGQLSAVTICRMDIHVKLFSCRLVVKVFAMRFLEGSTGIEYLIEIRDRQLTVWGECSLGELLS